MANKFSQLKLDENQSILYYFFSAKFFHIESSSTTEYSFIVIERSVKVVALT